MGDLNAIVKALINRGWAHRLMLGHDYAPGLSAASSRIQVSDEPTRYLFVTKTAIRALLADGMQREAIDLMMRDVPRRFLTGEAEN